MKKNIEVTCECQPKKLSVFDEVFLKDGTKGTVVEFDKSPIGYDICIRSSIGGRETERRWIRRDEIADDEYEGDASDIKPNASNIEKRLTHVSRRVTTS
jgi:hypothetical protein